MSVASERHRIGKFTSLESRCVTVREFEDEIGSLMILLKTIETVCLRVAGGKSPRGPEKSEHCIAFLDIVEKQIHRKPSVYAL